MRIPFDPQLTAQQRAQLAYDNLLASCDGDPAAAFRSLCAFAQRQREGRRALTYDERWGSSKGGRILAAMDARARDQGEAGGGENLEDLENLLNALIGEDRARPVMKYIHDCRAAGAQDNPNWFEGRPNPGGTIEPMAGSLTHDPAGSRSGNAGAQDWSPRLQREFEDRRILADGRAQKSYAERFPDAARLGRAG
jgi:hypothetical protein